MGRVELVVFVPFIIIGETVEAEVTEVKDQTRAKLGHIVGLARQVEPACRFGACGGCQYQHVAYEGAASSERVADLFERIGGFSPEVVARSSPALRRVPQPHHDPQPVEQAEQRLNIDFVRWGRLVEGVFGARSPSRH